MNMLERFDAEVFGIKAQPYFIRQVVRILQICYTGNDYEPASRNRYNSRSACAGRFCFVQKGGVECKKQCVQLKNSAGFWPL